VLDFTPFQNKATTLSELSAQLTAADVRALTNEIIDAMLASLEGCVDADVAFVPDDPQAKPEDEGRGWTIAHIVAHTTATAEESAFVAAEMARGVTREGRSRYEMPWQEITTIAQCRQRLEESRRMRLACADLWPDEPHLDNRVDMPWLGEQLNAQGCFALGLWHDTIHVGQLAQTTRQAKAAR
jgi:hypothetical protein